MEWSVESSASIVAIICRSPPSDLWPLRLYSPLLLASPESWIQASSICLEQLHVLLLKYSPHHCVPEELMEHDGDGVWQLWPIWRFLWGRELCPPSSSWKIWSDWKKTWNSFKLFHFAYELAKSTKTILDWLTSRSSGWNLSDIPLIFKFKRSYFSAAACEFFHSLLKVAAPPGERLALALTSHPQPNTSHHTHQCSDGLSAGACWVATAERGRSAAGPAVSPPSPHPE